MLPANVRRRRRVSPIRNGSLLSMLLLCTSLHLHRTARKEREAAIRAEEERDAAREERDAAIEALKEESAAIEAAKAKQGEENVMAARASRDTSAGRDSLSADACLGVLRKQGRGGAGESDPESTLEVCRDPMLFDACANLQAFTGLRDDEFRERLLRRGRFHFEGEYLSWNPSTSTELAWYHASSADHLFANAVHPASRKGMGAVADKKYEPVLEYGSGGGNNVLYLATRGIRVHYFGIGMAEHAFARYRVRKNGLEDLVEFKTPFSDQTGHVFDPINGPLPQDGSLGSVLALDVLQHIPKCHAVVAAMVKSIRVGGIIVENNPFAEDDVEDGEEVFRVHVSNGDITMSEAMGPNMKLVKRGVWEKIAE